MKKRILSVSLLAFVVLFGSCTKIKEVLTVKVDADFSVNLPVTIPELLLKSTTGAFTSTETLDPLSDEDLALYKDKIKGFEVTGMTGTISDLSADVTLTTATLLVNTAANSTQWTFTNLSLTNGSVIAFDNTSDQWTEINKILDEQTEITVTFSGNSSQNNVTFNLEVDFETKVSAKIL